MTSTVVQANLPDVLRDHNQRLRALEGQVGRWIYVLPIAPGTPPQDFNADDPLSPDFENGWGNVTAQQPVSFRIHPATRVQIRGAINGGSIPSIVFTLPENYRPTQGPAPVLFPSTDGSTAYTGRIDTDGSVWILEALAVGDYVTSFNGRTGAVLPGDADYLAVHTGGLTGATVATRFVGGTASGPPVTGTFQVGDFVVTQDGHIFVNVIAGSPGIWVDVLSHGVTSIARFGSPALTGAVTLSEGTNITLFQNGQDIQISTTDGAVGAEISYCQITAPVTVSSANELAPTTVITCGPKQYDGAPVMMQVWFPYAGVNPMQFGLYEGGVEITRLSPVPATSGESEETSMWYRFIPLRGAHTFTIGGWKTGGSDGTVFAGPGGQGLDPPAFVRFTKANAEVNTPFVNRPVKTTTVRQHRTRYTKRLSPPAVVGAGVAFHGPAVKVTYPIKLRFTKTVSRLEPPAVVGAGVVFRDALVALANQVKRRFTKTTSSLRPPAVAGAGVAFRGPARTLAPQRRGRPTSHLRSPAVVGRSVAFRGPARTFAPQRRGRPFSRLRPPAVVGNPVAFRGPAVKTVNLGNFRPTRSINSRLGRP